MHKYILSSLIWPPFLLKGFGFNLLISFMSMSIGTVLGSFLGILQISPLPPWMYLYSILTMATVLASIVGVEEVMTLIGQVLASDGRSELLVPIYCFVLMWFFAYCYPIACLTIRLERKYALKL